MNPLTLLSGLTLQIKALLIVGIAIASFASGWKVHGWRTDAKQGHSITKQIKASDSLAKEAKTIIETKIVKEREIQYVYRDIKNKISNLDDNRVCFTNESLSLWNRAIAGADSNRAEPTRETATIDTASAKEVINNAADNFETCNSNSVKHNALIDKIETLDGKMCVCAQ